MKLLSWINESISNVEYNNLMHNSAYHAAEVISYSLKRANALEAIRQAHDAGYVTDEDHKAALIGIMKNEGFTLTFTK